MDATGLRPEDVTQDIAMFARSHGLVLPNGECLGRHVSRYIALGHCPCVDTRPHCPCDDALTDIERMGVSAKRRYLGHRLIEIEWLLQSFQYAGETPGPDTWLRLIRQMDPYDWGRVLDLNYLEASRQAIYQTLRDLNRAACGSCGF